MYIYVYILWRYTSYSVYLSSVYNILWIHNVYYIWHARIHTIKARASCIILYYIILYYIILARDLYLHWFWLLTHFGSMLSRTRSLDWFPSPAPPPFPECIYSRVNTGTGSGWRPNMPATGSSSRWGGRRRAVWIVRESQIVASTVGYMVVV